MTQSGTEQGSRAGTPQATTVDIDNASKVLLDAVMTSIEDSKAEDIVTIDLAGKTPIADYMIIAVGRSHRHVGAIADRLASDLKDHGYGTVNIEGVPACDWVLVDCGDVVVHLFRPEVRSFYNLEKMWSTDPVNPVARA